MQIVTVELTGILEANVDLISDDKDLQNRVESHTILSRFGNKPGLGFIGRTVSRLDS